MIGEMLSRLRSLFSGDSSWHREVTLVALAVIVLTGGFLRFRDLDWDYPPGGASSHQHPDERFLSIVANDLDWPGGLSEYFDTADSPSNPYNLPSVNSFVYGTFPLYVGKAAATLAGDDREGPGDSYDTSIRWGRRITALTSTASIILVFLVGMVVFGRGPALLGSLLYSLAVLPVQLAHFWTVDPYVTFFGLATILFSALLHKRHGAGVGWTLYLGIGVAVGLGMASKVAFWPIVLAPTLETASRIGIRDFPALGLRRGNTSRPARVNGEWMSDVAGLFLAALVSLIVFRIAQPGAFVGPGFLDIGINTQWWDDLTGEAARQSGSSGLPWVIQFADRPPYLESLKNMVFWGLGPTLGIAAWAAVAAGAVAIARTRDTSLLVPVILPIVFLFYFGGRFVVFMRYFEPVYPLLCLLAAWGMLGLIRAASGGRLPGPLLAFASRRDFDARGAAIGAAGAALALTVVATAWWSLAFQNVYTQEHTRVQASRWIYENVPPGAGITNEIWDDALPIGLPNYPPQSQYKLVATEPYEPDSVQKVTRLIYGDLSRNDRPGLIGADYVVLASDRVRLSVPRLERKYPATIRYYELLDSGELGFDLVKTFRVEPSFLGISINDSGAEESFSVYDHPTVRIYKKRPGWDPAAAVALLLDAHPERAINLQPGQGRTNGLQFTTAQAASQQKGGTFTDVFASSGPTAKWPAAWWFAWLELSALAAFPVTALLFRWLPDRGFGLTKLLGPLAVALVVWLLVAWGLFDFSRGLALAVFGLWLIAGVAAGTVVWPQISALLRRHWRSWLVAEALFIAVFLAFLALRAMNPDTWHHPQGGEKPMELAYLTAVIRSTDMPPYDPWFAGGSMNYYYWGWFFLAVPIRALRILPEVAFNFGVPTYAAVSAATVFSTVFNLAALSRRAFRGSWPAGLRPAVAGLAGAFFLVLAGNFDGLHQSVERFQRINTWHFLQDKPVVGGATGLIGGIVRFITGAELPRYDWWRSSRVHIGSIDITEFPLWSFTFADLHPHLMGLPFMGLVVALALGAVVSARAGDVRRAVAFAAILGLAVGLVRAVHTWDFPTAGLVAVAGLSAGQLVAPGKPSRRAGILIIELLVFGCFFLGPMLPYAQHTEVFNQGIIRAPERTPLYQHFAQFGIFAIVAGAYIAVAQVIAHRSWGKSPGERPGRWPGFPYVPGPTGMTVALGGAFLLAGVTWGDRYATVAISAVLELVLLNLLLLQWRARPRDDGAIIVTGLFAAGFAIAAGVDLVTLKGDIVRMNTVFKFSLQAWQLLATASGFGLWYVLGALPQALDGVRWRRAATNMAYAGACALVAAASIFLISGTPARLDARFALDYRGLDGLAYLDVATFREDAGTSDIRSDDREIALRDDRPLIEWLRNNVSGSPVIVEAVGPLYHWTGRISMNTGLPAVIGWDWHQQQQRWTYGGLIAERRLDTQRFYTQSDVPSAENYLRKYNVSYVVVGTEELVYATPEGLARLAKIPALTEVFRSGDYAIYEVDQSKLPLPALVIGVR